MSGMLTMMTGGDSKIVYIERAVSTGSYTAPTGYGLVTVEAIGGGGRGIGATAFAQRAGGGGGAYVSANSIVVTGGSTIVYYSVGGQATDSWVNVGTNSAPTTLTVGCLAKAGTNATSGVAGVSGGTSGSVGNIIRRGGTASVGILAEGAGAGGINGNGSNNNPGTIQPMGGGSGGSLGSAGTAPGGGGGGASTNGNNLSGAIGRVRITFYNEVWR